MDCRRWSRRSDGNNWLNEVDRAAIVARIELQHSYAEVASALGKPTANAARVAVVRALDRLIREMDRVG
jgi:DNA-directed RNA polymerase specialized sigma24 family protein